MNPKIKREKRIRRHKKIRAKIKGTNERPRLCVFKSLNHIYAQLIDDDKGKVLVAANDQELKNKKQLKGKIKTSFEVGKLLAEKAVKSKIEKVVFDRGGFVFHGRVKALAEGAKEGGLKF